jgi:oxygen-dependent protoporphyrinogen oxidase
LISPFVSERIGASYSPPISIVHLIYQSGAVMGGINGFGFLCAPSEKSDILGCIYVSSIFPNRAQQGETLFTVLLGGALNPEITNRPSHEIAETAHHSICKYLSVNQEPIFTSVHTWKESIPQYNIGHKSITGQLSNIEKTNSGLFFAGNYRGGISIGSCVTQAKATSSQITG